ncbi:hypothetical protein B0J11DRAFT_525278 [Dendryphion nanum]|uniref:Uncharacterized protein n=1 Tax=Dendryphion nanum TaxID=256645 RepID=A0A9P9IRK8_9PLEO|nr:hypothetical protein B0J11DRAFT_525278 [Dendryphion nanum]
MALRPFRKTKSSVDFELGVISPPQPQCTFSFLHPSASNPLGANPVRGKRTCPLIGNSCQVPILDLGLPDQMFLHTRMHTPETGRHFITVEEICPPSRATSHCSKPLPPLPPEETQTRASSPKPVVYAHIHNSPSPPKSNLRFKASQLYLRDDYRAHAPVLPISPLKPLSIIPSIPRPLSSDEEVRQYMSPRASTLDELITVRYGGEKIELEENDGLNMDLYESP